MSESVVKAQESRIRTLHGRNGVAGLLEVVLRVALALEDGRLGDGLQDDVVVRAVVSSAD